MTGGSFDSESDFDAQDQAEAFDEDSLQVGDDNERRTFEELPEVEDLTQVAGDRDEDEARALDADEFDEDAVEADDPEEDNELDYRAVTEEREDDLDGLGPEDGFAAGAVSRSEIDGLDETRDAGEAEGGEDDFTDFQSRGLGDDDLKTLGYAEDRDGQVRARPDKP
jgi:hypothetical protein